jgi:hypothetical protein
LVVPLLADRYKCSKKIEGGDHDICLVFGSLDMHGSSNPDISQKYNIGDISKGVANILYPAKKIYKKRKF